VPTDDEFRRVAEDVRALARSLARELRDTVEQARGDAWAARRSAREDAQRVKSDLRDLSRQYRRSGWAYPGCPGRRPPGSFRYWDAPAAAPGAPAPSPATTAGAAPPPAPPPASPPPVRHRRDGSTLIGILAVVFGLAWLVAGTHLFRVSGEAVLAIALLVLGAAMVVTARTDWALSWRSWPVWLGAALVMALVVSTVSPRFGGLRSIRIGSQATSYTSWDQVPPTIDGSLGRTLVDLSGLPVPAPRDTSLQILGGIGVLVVQLPPNLHVTLDANVGMGRIYLNKDELAGGFSPGVQQEINKEAPGPVLTLHIDTSGGTVRILEPDPTTPPSGP
jgi:hypothetical protein